MSLQLGPLIDLLRLRYRLLWAQARLRNGKIALFVVGYLLLCVLVPVFALGSLSAALASIRMGKAELVARVALSFFFLNALLAAVVLGFGMNSAFSDAALRRYPLSTVERLAARQITAFLEPLWMLILSLDLGLAIGFGILGVATLWLAVIAPLFMAPVVAGPVLIHIGGKLTGAAEVLQFTPPFAAAAVMAGAALLPALGWVLYLLAWCLALVVALAGLDRLPMPSRTIAGAQAAWDNPCDQVAAFFGVGLAPLVGKILRYYVRSPHLRFNASTTQSQRFS